MEKYIEEEDKEFLENISNKIVKDFKCEKYFNNDGEPCKVILHCDDNFLGSSYYYMLTNGTCIFDEILNEDRNEILSNFAINNCKGFVIYIEVPKLQEKNNDIIEYLDTDNMIVTIGLRLSKNNDTIDMCVRYIQTLSSYVLLVFKKVLLKVLESNGGIKNELR